jgi:formate transporter
MCSCVCYKSLGCFSSLLQPEEIVASIEVIAEYKTKLRPDKTFVLAIMAGVYVGLGVLVGGIMAWGAPNADPGVNKFLYAALFPTVLMFVIIVGAELVTSNFGTMTLGILAQRVTLWQATRNILVAYIGNLIGSLLLAVILFQATGFVDPAPWHNAFIAAAEKKVHLTFLQTFVRAMGCNFLVNIAVWMAQASEDITGKILAIWFPIAMFACAGMVS